MNRIFLIGNITKDPELTQTPSGVAVCKFTLAVNRFTAGGEKETDFFPCVAWRGQAETVARYTKKGDKLAVDGSVQLRNYEDNKGVKRTMIDVVVSGLELLGAKTATETDQNQTKPFSSINSTTERKSSDKKPILTPMETDEDIPF